MHAHATIVAGCFALLAAACGGGTSVEVRLSDGSTTNYGFAAYGVTVTKTADAQRAYGVNIQFARSGDSSVCSGSGGPLLLARYAIEGNSLRLTSTTWGTADDYSPTGTVDLGSVRGLPPSTGRPPFTDVVGDLEGSLSSALAEHGGGSQTALADGDFFARRCVSLDGESAF